MKKIRQMKCEVQSKCQNDCVLCAHGEQRRLLPHYELSLADLQKFLDVSRDSGYYIDDMRIHGPGEPLLWRHFNEGVGLMKDSGIIGSIFVATNGQLLEKITDDTWDCIDEMRVSLYSSFDRHEKLHEIIDRFPDKVMVNKVDTFRTLPVAGEEASIPCRCVCDGPMLLGDRIFLYCGPPIFAAAHLFEENALGNSELSVSVGRNWLDSYDEQRMGNMKYCKRCWANSNYSSEKVPHEVKGGKWRFMDNYI
ncbi:hypothetical protein ACFL6N_07165 [Thermodesulfobacteriota bacterium]